MLIINATQIFSFFESGNQIISHSALCPLVGSIPCGSAQTEEENVREYISLPVSLFGKSQ